MQDARITLRPDVLMHAVDDEAVLYDLGRDTVHYLNATSTFVWRQFESGRTGFEIERAAVRTFADGATPRESIVAGVRDAVAMFRRDGLLAGADG